MHNITYHFVLLYTIANNLSILSMHGLYRHGSMHLYELAMLKLKASGKKYSQRARLLCVISFN